MLEPFMLDLQILNLSILCLIQAAQSFTLSAINAKNVHNNINISKEIQSHLPQLKALLTIKAMALEASLAQEQKILSVSDKDLIAYLM
jgi:hypothetical protein